MSLTSCGKWPNSECLKVSICSKLLCTTSVVFPNWVTYNHYGAPLSLSEELHIWHSLHFGPDSASNIVIL